MNAREQKVDVLADLQQAIDTCAANNLPGTGGALIQVHAAVAELIEAASLRVECINTHWYVLHGDGQTAWSNVGHRSSFLAREEADEALKAALARVGGAS